MKKHLLKSVLIAMLFAIGGWSNIANAQTLFKDLVPGANQGSQPQDFITVNGTMYFITTINGSSPLHRLWKSDGTPTGTEIVMDSIINTNVGDVIHLINVNGTLFFAVNKNGSSTTATRTDLWKTDGTTAGTVFIDSLKNGDPLSATGDYPPQNFTAVGNKLFFQMGSGNGIELWVSDGTAAGTMEVIDLATGSSGGYKLGGAENAPMGAYNGKVYFAGSTTGFSGSYKLYSSDGTAAGTTIVNNIEEPTGWIIYNNELYLFSQTGTNAGMWKTDGTTSSLIFAGEFSGAKIFKNEMYFKNGINLWKSDGTTGGTLFVTDSANVITGANNDYLFTSYMKSISSPPYYQMIYKRTDGIAGGTTVSKNLGASASFNVVSNKMYQTVADPGGVYTSSLWVSDGTEVGTSNVFANQYLGYPFAYDGNIFYSYYATGMGYELGYFVTGITGITEISNSNSLQLFPNPAVNSVKIVSQENETAMVKIYDISGKIVFEKQIALQAKVPSTIDVQSFYAGVYFVQIQTTKNIKTQKLIIQK